MKKKTLLLILAAFAATSFTSAQAATMSLSDKGVLTAGNTTWRTLFMDKSWRAITQDNNFIVSSSADGTYKGAFKLSSGEYLFDYDIAYTTTPGGYKITSNISNADGVRANMIAFQGTLTVKDFAGKTVQLDGTSVTLPALYSGKQNVAMQYANTVTIPTSSGPVVFKGGFDVMILDARKYKDPKFFVRIMFKPHKGTITKSILKATVTSGQ